MLNTGNKPKKFWERPEGVTGMLFLGAGIFLLFWFWNAISAFVISALASMLHAIFLFAILGIIVYIILDKRMRTLVWYMFKSIMRWITGIFVQIDPIGILESYVDYLYKNLKEMNTHISKLRGQMTKLKSVISKNKEEMASSLKIAEQAKKKGNMDLVAINTRQYGRLKEANERYNTLLNKMEILYRVLNKIHKNSGYLIKDIENEVRMRKQERAAIKASHSAMKRAMNIIQGDPDKKAIFDMAMESIVDDVSNKIGEMERFIEISSSFIDSVDLQNGVYEQEGLALLEKMEEDGVSFLLGDSSASDFVDSETKTDNNKDIEVDVDKNFSSYKNLFD